MTKYNKAIEFIIKEMEGKLDANLVYHGLAHTKDVLCAVENIALAEGVTREELNLLKVAAAYHDSGFIYVYKNHEEEGCKIVAKNLPEFGFSSEEIEVVQNMIMATKVPQQPKTRLEKIICDADLDYLGRDDFHEISEKLFVEFKNWEVVDSYESWMSMQINFLESHLYWTDFSKKYRRNNKIRQIENLKEL